MSGFRQCAPESAHCANEYTLADCGETGSTLLDFESCTYSTLHYAGLRFHRENVALRFSLCRWKSWSVAYVLSVGEVCRMDFCTGTLYSGTSKRTVSDRFRLFVACNNSGVFPLSPVEHLPIPSANEGNNEDHDKRITSTDARYHTTDHGSSGLAQTALETRTTMSS